MSLAVEDDVDGRLVRLETDVAHIRLGLGEVKAEIRDLRSEIGGSARELTDRIVGVKEELMTRMHEMKADLKGDLAAIRVDNIRTRVWTLGVGAGLLGVLAPGFHWI